MRPLNARLLLVPFLLFVSACAGDPAPAPYPFPPQFVQVDQIDPRVIAAPPTQNSVQYRTEIDGIIARQHSLTDADKATLMAEDHITPGMMIDPVLGKDYPEAKFPALYTLLRHAASDAWRLGDHEQDYWHRTRPWLTDNHVEILVSTIKRPSYPSGHSTTNHVWAHILGDLFPDHRDAFFKRAYEIGMHRTLAGVHYPSDVEAGKEFAAVIYAQMEKNPAFDKEYQAASDEIAAAMSASLPAKAIPDPANDSPPVLNGALPTPPAPPQCPPGMICTPIPPCPPGMICTPAPAK